jgi:hypothetical protein
MLTEVNIGRTLVEPKFQRAGWDNDPHSILDRTFKADL